MNHLICAITIVALSFTTVLCGVLSIVLYVKGRQLEKENKELKRFDRYSDKEIIE